MIKLSLRAGTVTKNLRTDIKYAIGTTKSQHMKYSMLERGREKMKPNKEVPTLVIISEQQVTKFQNSISLMCTKCKCIGHCKRNTSWFRSNF